MILQPAGDRVIPGYGDRRIGEYLIFIRQVLLESDARRQRLERRTGLIRIGNASVTPAVCDQVIDLFASFHAVPRLIIHCVRHGVRFVEVIIRERYHRMDGARIRVHYNGADTVAGLVFLVGTPAGFLGDPLDADIDIQHEVVAVYRLLVRSRRIRQVAARLGVNLRIPVAVRTGERSVVICLKSVDTLYRSTVVIRISYNL